MFFLRFQFVVMEIFRQVGEEIMEWADPALFQLNLSSILYTTSGYRAG